MKQIIVLGVTAAIGIGLGLFGGIQVQKTLSAKKHESELLAREAAHKEAESKQKAAHGDEISKQRAEFEKANRELTGQLTDERRLKEEAIANDSRRKKDWEVKLVGREKTQIQLRALAQILSEIPEEKSRFVTNVVAVTPIPLEHLTEAQQGIWVPLKDKVRLLELKVDKMAQLTKSVEAIAKAGKAGGLSSTIAALGTLQELQVAIEPYIEATRKLLKEIEQLAKQLLVE